MHISNLPPVFRPLQPPPSAVLLLAPVSQTSGEVQTDSADNPATSVLRATALIRAAK
jgi:hypothetical protein